MGNGARVMHIATLVKVLIHHVNVYIIVTMTSSA